MPLPWDDETWLGSWSSSRKRHSSGEEAEWVLPACPYRGPRPLVGLAGQGGAVGRDDTQVRSARPHIGDTGAVTQAARGARPGQGPAGCRARGRSGRGLPGGRGDAAGRARGVRPSCLRSGYLPPHRRSGRDRPEGADRDPLVDPCRSTGPCPGVGWDCAFATSCVPSRLLEVQGAARAAPHDGPRPDAQPRTTGGNPSRNPARQALAPPRTKRDAHCGVPKMKEATHQPAPHPPRARCRSDQSRTERRTCPRAGHGRRGRPSVRGRAHHAAPPRRRPGGGGDPAPVHSRRGSDRPVAAGTAMGPDDLRDRGRRRDLARRPPPQCGDHYAYFDRTITQIHYLRYSDLHFSLWNNSLQYQNRMRANEFIEIAESCRAANPSQHAAAEAGAARAPRTDAHRQVVPPLAARAVVHHFGRLRRRGAGLSPAHHVRTGLPQCVVPSL